jgi:serine O-acetyltransferase
MNMHPGAFRADLARYYRTEPGCLGPTLSAKLRIWITNFGLHCVACYRFGQYANQLYTRNRFLGLLPRCIHFLLGYVAQMVHHVCIDAASIGPGLYIGHVGTIYVGPCVIGSNFSLTHNVTVGIGHSRGMEGIPTIGDDVWIGTGSILSGAITIGNRVTIASGTVLSRSVPDGCLVGGNPGRVIMRDYDNRRLIGGSNDEAAPNEHAG